MWTRTALTACLKVVSLRATNGFTVTVRAARSKDVKAGAKLQDVQYRYSAVIHHIYPGVSQLQSTLGSAKKNLGLRPILNVLMIEDTSGVDAHDYTPTQNCSGGVFGGGRAAFWGAKPLSTELPS